VSVYPRTRRPTELSHLEARRREAAFVGDWERCRELDAEICRLRRRMHDEDFLRRAR
jgi:hypothetical protein